MVNEVCLIHYHKQGFESCPLTSNVEITNYKEKMKKLLT